MGNKHFAGIGDPWPFRHMEVGDIAICLSEHTYNRAHAYGHAVRKRFSVRRTTSKSGQEGFMVVRLPDNTPVNRIQGRPRGRPRKTWPYEALKPGQTFTCLDPDVIPKIMNSVHRTNQLHRRISKQPSFAMRTHKGSGLTYKSLTVMRLR